MRKSAKKGVQFSPVDRFLRTDVLTWDMLGARLTHRRRTPATCRFTWGLLGGRCTPRLGGSAAAPDSVRRARDSPAHAQNCQKKGVQLMSCDRVGPRANPRVRRRGADPFTHAANSRHGPPHVEQVWGKDRRTGVARFAGRLVATVLHVMRQANLAAAMRP